MFDDYEPDSEWDDDDEGDDFGGSDPDEADFSFNCPECGTLLHEEASVCPSCGYFILDSDRTSPSLLQTPWFKILGLVGIIAVVLTLLAPLLLR